MRVRVVNCSHLRFKMLTDGKVGECEEVGAAGGRRGRGWMHLRQRDF